VLLPTSIAEIPLYQVFEPIERMRRESSGTPIGAATLQVPSQGAPGPIRDEHDIVEVRCVLEGNGEDGRGGATLESGNKISVTTVLLISNQQLVRIFVTSFNMRECLFEQWTHISGAD
jgi:hypothetical protein